MTAEAGYRSGPADPQLAAHPDQRAFADQFAGVALDAGAHGGPARPDTEHAGDLAGAVVQVDADVPPDGIEDPSADLRGREHLQLAQRLGPDFAAVAHAERPDPATDVQESLRRAVGPADPAGRGLRADGLLRDSLNAGPRPLVAPETGQPPGDFVDMDGAFDLDDADDSVPHDGWGRLVQREVGARIDGEVGFDVSGRSCSGAGSGCARSTSAAAGTGAGARTAASAERARSQRIQEFRHLGIAAVEPVGAPDAVERPALLLEDDLTQAVALARPAGGVVARAVALHGEQEAALVVGVVDRQVDAEAGGSDLGGHAVTVAMQGLGDGLPRRGCPSRHRSGRGYPVRRSSAYLRYLFSTRGPACLVVSTRISPWRMEEKTRQRFLERVKSTLSRRSPPSLETGPKFCDM